MADANSQLKKMAHRIANALEGRTLQLNREMQEAELRLSELKLEAESSRAAHERSPAFLLRSTVISNALTAGSGATRRLLCAPSTAPIPTTALIAKPAKESSLSTFETIPPRCARLY